MFCGTWVEKHCYTGYEYQHFQHGNNGFCLIAFSVEVLVPNKVIFIITIQEFIKSVQEIIFHFVLQSII